MKTLDASPTSDLEWGTEKSSTYYLDFSFHQFDPFDGAAFYARFLAVEEFAKQFPEAKKAIMAKITAPLSAFFKPSLEVDELEAAEEFSKYVHRLASALPDDTIPVIWCEVPAWEPYVLPLCRRRFEHFAFHFTQAIVPIEGTASTAISLPQDDRYDPALFDRLFKELEGISFKCIPEEHLNEHWDEVDYLIVAEELQSDLGKRMLLGFEAAGGEILYVNENGQVNHPAKKGSE